jgi:hypothetical protein
VKYGNIANAWDWKKLIYLISTFVSNVDPLISLKGINFNNIKISIIYLYTLFSYKPLSPESDIEKKQTVEVSNNTDSDVSSPLEIGKLN